MKKALLLALLLLVAPFCHAEEPSERAIRRVVVVSIDGLRPDMLLRTNTPNMHGLMDSGSFSFWARTTALCITLPSHTSMLTGVIPRKHEIEWNKDLPLSEPVYPSFPTLFEVAKKGGYTTAMVAGKSKFTVLAKPGTLDWSFISPTEKTGDDDVAKHAVEIIRQHKPEVLFVHFPGVDNVGHADGWGSREQARAVEKADGALGDVLSALKGEGLTESTLIILTADHGGAGRTHVPDDARSRHIPWIAVGPGVRKNVDLTTYADLVINTEDTFATACYVLGLPLDKRLDGKPVKEIFVEDELLHAKAK